MEVAKNQNEKCSRHYSGKDASLHDKLNEPPEVVRRRIVENLMRTLSADEVFSYDDSDDGALLDCSDIERREAEKKDIRQKNKVVVHDASGLDIYLNECRKWKVVPNTQIMRQLGNYQLQLRHNYLKMAEVSALTAALKANTIVEDLDLSDNHLEDDLGTKLLSFLKENGFVTHLNLSLNFIASKSIEKLCRMMAFNTSIRSLVLSSNKLRDDDAKTIGDFLQSTTTLTNLDLSHNCFGEKGGLYLGAAIQINDSLRELDLSWNSLRQKGAVGICSSLKENDSLEILDLSWNGLAFGGAVALKQALLVNTTLKVLDISNTRIEVEGAKHLAAGLASNSALESLHLSRNPLGDLGVDAILKGIQDHDTLRTLDLKDIVVSHENFAHIHQLQASKGVHIPTGGTWSGIKSDDEGPNSLQILNNFVIENNLRLVDIFNRFDKDKSGDVTLVELKNGLKEIGIKMTNRQLDEMLKEVDSDRSGTIDYQEFLNSRLGVQLGIREEKKAARRAQRKKALRVKRELKLPEMDTVKLIDLFNKFDTDRSGEITVAEFKIGLKEIGIKLTEVQLESVIDVLDVDGSGTIDYAELKAKLIVDSGAASIGNETEQRSRSLTQEGASILRLSNSSADEKRKNNESRSKKTVRLATPIGDVKEENTTTTPLSETTTTTTTSTTLETTTTTIKATMTTMTTTTGAMTAGKTKATMKTKNSTLTKLSQAQGIGKGEKTKSPPKKRSSNLKPKLL